ncbi:MAG: hypothetical protein OSA98_09380 [Rubripirellula sp.]|nr:hypothetical protein [Rubripirellula sp.]
MKTLLQLAATALLALSTSQASAALSVYTNVASVQQQDTEDPQADFMNELESTYFLLLDMGFSPAEADDIILETLEVAIFGKVGSANVGLTQPHYYNLQQTDRVTLPKPDQIAVLGQANGLTGDSVYIEREFE